MTPIVYIVDDDAAVRRGLEQLIASGGFMVRSFASAEAFLAACEQGCAGCVVLDVAMPGMGGPQLQSVLAQRGLRLPIVFLTAHGDVATSVRAMKAGAVDFLEKPVSGATLIAAVRKAMALEARQHEDHALRAAARARYAKLTAREREVMALAVAGLPNKEIGKRLELSYRTVEIHRARAMRKMRATTLLELAHAAALCGIDATGAAPAADPDAD
ncbi:MAG: response regulator [Burkholderiales bacterium]|nr:response regulator [Burkholderiales bacterium]